MRVDRPRKYKKTNGYQRSSRYGCVEENTRILALAYVFIEGSKKKKVD